MKTIMPTNSTSQTKWVNALKNSTDQLTNKTNLTQDDKRILNGSVPIKSANKLWNAMVSQVNSISHLREIHKLRKKRKKKHALIIL